MNSLLNENEHEDFVKTVEALLKESREDQRILMQELEKKQAEIQEKMELISCLSGEPLPMSAAGDESAEADDQNPAGDHPAPPTPAESVPKELFQDLEVRVSERVKEVDELKSHIQFYSGKLAGLEQKASKIASLGDMTVEVLKKHIEKLNAELKQKDEIIAELKKGNGDVFGSKKLSSKVKNLQAGQPSE